MSFNSPSAARTSSALFARVPLARPSPLRWLILALLACAGVALWWVSVRYEVNLNRGFRLRLSDASFGFRSKGSIAASDRAADGFSIRERSASEWAPLLLDIHVAALRGPAGETFAISSPLFAATFATPLLWSLWGSWRRRPLAITCECGCDLRGRLAGLRCPECGLDLGVPAAQQPVRPPCKRLRLSALSSIGRAFGWFALATPLLVGIAAWWISFNYRIVYYNEADVRLNAGVITVTYDRNCFATGGLIERELQPVRDWPAMFFEFSWTKLPLVFRRPQVYLSAATPFLTAIFALPLVIALVCKMRRRRNRANVSCGCGYDLRGQLTGLHCVECKRDLGLPIAPAAQPVRAT